MAAPGTENKPRYHGLRVTREEYLDIEEDGFLYEMIDGVLYMTPSAFFDHNRTLVRLTHFVEGYLEEHPLAVCVTETDILLPDGGDVLRPDLSVVLKAHYGIIKGHIHGAPDIIFEVLSASTIRRDLGIKAERYLKTGVEEYWIADPEEKTLRLWTNEDRSSWKKQSGDALTSAVLPGLQIEVARLFRSAI